MTLWHLMYQVHRFMRDGTTIADRKCRIYSEEGMAKAKAKDWRAYTIDNPDISHAGVPMFRRYMCIRPDASLLWKDGNADCQRSLFEPFPHAVYRWHVLSGFACGEDYRKA